jgi:hypothetical protein
MIINYENFIKAVREKMKYSFARRPGIWWSMGRPLLILNFNRRALE